jgi:glycosyltransferase involved in cell wall biosynthesis
MAFPTKVAEYLMTGRPVVTSDVGDVGELLRHGGACVVPPGDMDRFAERLEQLLGDPEKAEEIGASGREIALRDLDATRYGHALRGFFRDVVRVYPRGESG